jgi:hypothetical protein
VGSYQLAFPLHYSVNSLYLQEKNNQHSSKVTARLVPCQWGLLPSVKSFGNTCIRWMELLPSSRRPTHPVHDPIQPALLEFSRELDALHFHLGQLNDRGLISSWKQQRKTDRLDPQEAEHVGSRTRASVSRGHL